MWPCIPCSSPLVSSLSKHASASAGSPPRHGRPSMTFTLSAGCLSLAHAGRQWASAILLQSPVWPLISSCNPPWLFVRVAPLLPATHTGYSSASPQLAAPTHPSPGILQVRPAVGRLSFLPSLTSSPLPRQHIAPPGPGVTHGHRYFF